MAEKGINPNVGASLINLGGSIFGGVAELIGGSASADAQREQMEKNIQLQREFAQNGIRWKVDDARRAGIHPLYALGANTTSFSPVTVGDTSIGSAFSSMGQNLGRAISATRTADEREEALADLTLERAKLENELLLSQIANLNSSRNPPMPTVGPTPDLMLDGQGDSRKTPKRMVVDQPLSRTVSQPGRPFQQAGAISDFGYVKTPHGYAVVPSKDVKEAIEDQALPEANWAFRNQLLPNFDPRVHSPPAKPPKGYDYWRWDYLRQQYVPGKTVPRHPVMDRWESTRNAVKRFLGY